MSDLAPGWTDAGNPRLADGMSLRREPFGGIAYSHRTRDLYMIRSPEAVDVALRLDAGATLDQLASESVAAGRDRSRRVARLRLDRLVTSLRERGILA